MLKGGSLLSFQSHNLVTSFEDCPWFPAASRDHDRNDRGNFHVTLEFHQLILSEPPTTATMFIDATGAGITVDAGTRLALQLIISVMLTS